MPNMRWTHHRDIDKVSVMELYFSPLACSLATRICLYEANAEARYIAVDRKTGRTADGDDFRTLNPLGLVPVIRTDTGEILTENAAILQYIALRYPEAQLMPTDEHGRLRVQQWLCFIGTELHKGLFAPLLDKGAPAAVHQYTLARYRSRLDYLAQQLADRTFLTERFSIADAYLIAVLNWTVATPLKLTDWPALVAYHERSKNRPGVAQAIREEVELYQRAS